MEFIPPRYRVVAIDETSNWADDVTAIVGRIAGIYVINFAESVHLCSLEGSYWAEFICNITEHPYREPDGYNCGQPIWDMQWAAENPEEFERSKALLAAYGKPCYGLEYDNGGESGMYVSGRFPEPQDSLIDLTGAGWDDDPDTMSPDDAEKYRRERDEAAYEAAREYMSNGEDWQSIAPWAK